MKNMEGGLCRNADIQVGEVDLNLIRPDLPQMVVKFALVRADDVTSGFFHKRDNWSAATHQLLVQFIDSLEQDGLADLFQGGNVVAVEDDDAEAPKKPSEPPQF